MELYEVISMYRDCDRDWREGSRLGIWANYEDAKEFQDKYTGYSKLKVVYINTHKDIKRLLEIYN